MTTRLDRLFLLLDTGSTPVIRRSAAEQLGEVQKLHPHELNNLLTKVHGYLGSASWETRIAAGHAVEAIVKNVGQWKPPGGAKNEPGDDIGGASISSAGRLGFAQFDIGRVLVHGASLLGSEGVEYDTDDESLGLDQKERLSRQRQLLNKRLGLDVAANLGFGSHDLFKDEDLVSQNRMMTDPGKPQRAVMDLVQQQIQMQNVDRGMSSRERNRAKRKAKLMARQVSTEPKATNSENGENEPASKKRKTNSVMVCQPSTSQDESKILLDNVPDNTLNIEEMDEWPFDSFAELLLNDLFHPSWERRHGAATGLREVLKQHAEGAGKTIDTPAHQMELANQQWLEDVALRLVCVLALDRFGDFVSDEVVAPVRETCAQTLGVIVRVMQRPGVFGVMSVLLQLLCKLQWEVRHGGLLGMKYLLAVRKDLTSDLLPTVLPYIFRSLQDHDDDVRAVAASSLLPVTQLLVELKPAEIGIIVNCLWDTLLDLDDLTSSTNSIMELLASLLANPKARACDGLAASLSDLVPRLWPFLRHNIVSVRKCALEMLITVLKYDSPQHPVSVWLTPILQDALRHVYQRSLLEHDESILDLIYKAWHFLVESAPLDYLVAASGPWLGVWLCLMMQPASMPFDPNLLIEAKHRHKDPVPGKQRPLQETEGTQEQHKDYIGGFRCVNEAALIRDACVTRSRIMAGRLLGVLASCITRPVPNYPAGLDTPAESLAKLLLFHLESKAALQRLAVALLVMQWAHIDQNCQCADSVKDRLLQCLNENIYYDEIALSFTRMQTECKDFIASLKHCGIEMDAIITPGSVLTFDQALALPTTIYDSVKAQLMQKKQQTFDERRKQLVSMVTNAKDEQQTHTIRVQLCLAKALVHLKSLPEKLNPVVRPLMEAIKKDENVQLQTAAAQGLSLLLQQCITRQPSPNAKVIKNLCTFLCCDSQFTPQIAQMPTPNTTGASSCEIYCDKYSGILTLNAQNKPAEKVGRGNSVAKKPLPGATVDVPKEAIQQTPSDQSQQTLAVQRRGAEIALTTIAANAGVDLASKLPSVWEAITQPLSQLSPEEVTDLNKLKEDDTNAQDLIHSLQALQTIGPALHPGIHSQVIDKLPSLCMYMQHPYTAVRHMTARCLGMLSKLVTFDTMNYTMDNILPALGASHSQSHRQGAMETLTTVVEVLGADIIPYIVLLVVPVLGCMSDQDEAVRLTATQCFATLIKLMPLEAGIPDPPSMKSSLIQRKEKERKFLEQLLDGSKLEDYQVPVPIKAELRKYQQDGVNWLAFLNKYKLHGILCDDMGLGKTLQSICILAGDHFLRKKRYQETKDVDSVALQSLVVCPPTLTGHWVYEIEKFVDAKYLNPLHYTGPPAERQRLRSRAKKHNMIVASYDIVRNDIEFFGAIKWNYCILDEGHIIKNGKTKLSRAIKQLSCNHRLILSGTPIQNNVLELWSLFDFLMPGFLGTEKQFGVRYGKPILQSRDAKSSSKEQEAGALAMEGLHRQVLPFLLRRLKEDVLQDLPPKIIQDYVCDLSPLQVQLYEDFAKSRAKKGVEDEVLDGTSEKEKKASVGGHTHVFQALQYLRKVCNHPALVMTSQHPEHDNIMAQLKQQNSSLHDIQHATKLLALKQLLTDCGIGLTQQSGSSQLPVVNQHRVLLFCQLKSMLDIVEKDLFRSHMPSVTYLRLDGNVPAGNRHSIVNRFNNDPSIDVLLLTTHVGGLGLNLTGADTVIFVEHDWNPMKDLQAMDRAHRIGQKKVVNVYRLVTRGTLEEKIMGLQKFKITIANTVINQDNAGLQSMATDQLLDLFSLDSEKKGAESNKDDRQSDGKMTMKSVLDNMDELWDSKQYDDEYNLDSFMKSLS